MSDLQATNLTGLKEGREGSAIEAQQFHKNSETNPEMSAKMLRALAPVRRRHLQCRQKHLSLDVLRLCARHPGVNSACEGQAHNRSCQTMSTLCPLRFRRLPVGSHFRFICIDLFV
jgi:hypothetical protein